MTNDKQKQGKMNRAAGQRFERKVREDLEKRGFIVSKWQNNVVDGKIVPAKMGRFRSNQGGFPDFVVWHSGLNSQVIAQHEGKEHHCVGVFGVEVKSNGYLRKEEKEKCEFLEDKDIFLNVLVASKGKKRGEIVYKYFTKSTNTFK